jgi:cell shape-determining protein MreC
MMIEEQAAEIESLQIELYALRAENEKLREVLMKIEMLWFNDDSGARNSYDAFMLAKAALEEK